MENLYKENSMKLNNEISKEQKNYVKYGKYADMCDTAFKGLAIGHILIAGIYSLGIIVPAMLSVAIPPLVTPTVIGLVISCLFSVSGCAILQGYFEKKQEKASKRFDRLEHMKRKYDEKPYEHKKSVGKMVCKEVISNYNYSKDKNMSLSLRK